MIGRGELEYVRVSNAIRVVVRSIARPRMSTPGINLAYIATILTVCGVFSRESNDSIFSVHQRSGEILHEYLSVLAAGILIRILLLLLLSSSGIYASVTPIKRKATGSRYR
jgi:hypothetical protein